MSKLTTPEQIRERIYQIARQDGRYAAGAFFFVTDAISNTVKWLKSGELEPRDVANCRGGQDAFHVSGFELLAGIRKLARERWGCLARPVLEHWGVKRTEDIGEIVFLMVDDEKLDWRKREQDSKDDFRSGYDFAAVFDPWED